MPITRPTSLHNSIPPNYTFSQIPLEYDDLVLPNNYMESSISENKIQKIKKKQYKDFYVKTSLSENILLVLASISTLNTLRQRKKVQTHTYRQCLRDYNEQFLSTMVVDNPIHYLKL